MWRARSDPKAAAFNGYSGVYQEVYPVYPEAHLPLTKTRRT